jgi:hypothetical protein
MNLQVRKAANKFGLRVIDFKRVVNVSVWLVALIVLLSIVIGGKYGFGQYKAASQIVASDSVFVDGYVYNNNQLTQLIKRSTVIDDIPNTSGYHYINYYYSGTRFDSLSIAAVLEPSHDSVFDWQVYTKYNHMDIDDSRYIVFRSEYWETVIKVKVDESLIFNTNTWMGANPYVKWNVVWDNKRLYYVPFFTNQPFTFLRVVVIIIIGAVSWLGSYVIVRGVVAPIVDKYLHWCYDKSFDNVFACLNYSLSYEMKGVNKKGFIKKAIIYARMNGTYYVYYSYKKTAVPL